jgi:RNA polymerase sigma-70 factor (family 1)
LESKDQNDELLKALKANDRRKGMALVFKRFYNEMVDYAWNITGSGKMAEDVVMEVFLRLLQKNFDFESVNNLKAYLMITVRNSCFAVLEAEEKRHKRQQEVKSTLETWETLDFELMDAIITQQVYSEIDKLPTKARTIFILKTFNRYSYEEIAERMEITAKTVKNQYFIALARLRTTFLKKNLLCILTFNTGLLQVFIASLIPGFIGMYHNL